MEISTFMTEPGELGLSWETGPVNYDRDGQKITLGDAPYLLLSDPRKFIEAVPTGKDILLGTWNGQSVKVQCQNVTRESLRKNMKVTVDELKEKIIKRVIFKARVVTAVGKFELPDGTRTNDRDEFFKAWGIESND